MPKQSHNSAGNRSSSDRPPTPQGLPSGARTPGDSEHSDCRRDEDTEDSGRGGRSIAAGGNPLQGEKVISFGACGKTTVEPFAHQDLPGQQTGSMPAVKEREKARQRSPWRCSLPALATVVFSLASILLIGRSFTTQQRDPKGCRMTYMTPGYAKLDGFDTEHTRFASKYSLYLYREMGVEEDTMVRGVPVLFITGNAGSHRQVRSLASEAARYFRDTLSQNSEALRNGASSFDFFTADFNEDFTAFHGQTLLDQAEYLNEAVAYILSMYHDSSHPRRARGLPDPSSVILIGHSMGGIVARTMLTMPNYQSNSVNTIITVSTPHARAPVAFDEAIISTYYNVNSYWRQAHAQKWASDNPLWHVTLVSIAGGGLDTTVPSDYCSISSVVPETHGFTVFTSSIPNVWTGCDHLSILWCEQTTKIIIKSLFEAVDVRRPSQTKPRAERMRIFKKWYLTGMEDIAERSLPQTEPSTLLTLEDNVNSILAIGERLVLRSFGHSGKSKAYLLPIPPQQSAGAVAFNLLTDQMLDTTGGDGKLEVLFCSVFPLSAGHTAAVFSMNMDLSGGNSGSTRLACKNTAADTIHVPASTTWSRQAFDDTNPFSHLSYKVDELADHQFVAVVDKSRQVGNGWVIAEFVDQQDQLSIVDVGRSSLLFRGVHVNSPAARPLITEVKVPAMSSSLLAFKVRVGPQACGDTFQLFQPLIRQYISDPHESKWFVNVHEADINSHGVAPYMPPPMPGHTTTSALSLQVWSDPSCDSSLELSIKFDFMGSVGKIVMRYGFGFLAFPLIIVPLVMLKQFSTYDKTGTFIPFSEALDLSLRSTIPGLLVGLVVHLTISHSSDTQLSLSTPAIMHLSRNGTDVMMDFSKNDRLIGTSDLFWWFLIPLFGVISAGGVLVLHQAVLILVNVGCIFYSSISNTINWRLLNDRRRPNTGEFSAASLRRRLFLVIGLLMVVATFIPHQFAYAVACLVQLVTCSRALREAKETRSLAHYNFFYYSLSLLNLMLWILPINIPVLVVWIHNLSVHWLTPFTSHHNVMSIMSIILLVEIIACGKMVPRITSSVKHITTVLLFGFAVLSAVRGFTWAYQLHQLANIFCTWLVLVHLSGNTTAIAGIPRFLGGKESVRVLSPTHGKKTP